MKVTDIEPCIKVTKEEDGQESGMYIEFGDRIRITDNEGKTIEGRFYYFESGSEVQDDDLLHIVLEDENQHTVEAGRIENIEIIER